MEIERVFRRGTFLVMICLSAFVLSGCVHIPTLQYPPFPDQSKKVEDPAKARIYLVRPAHDVNSQVEFLFFGTTSSSTGPRLNPGPQEFAVPLLGIFPKNPAPETPWRLIGKVGPGSYLCWEELPRRFSLPPIKGETNNLSFIDLMPGNVYYLRASTPGFWQPKSMIEIINEEDGQKLLSQCQPPDDYRKRKSK
jgi:hypothetical protein